MYPCISGFLADSSEDESLKFELDLDESHIQGILPILGLQSINEMAAGEWLLSNEQIMKVSALVGRPLPTDLQMFIGLEA
ncbi:pyocin S6 family toxin immunity protein [Pseudomonas graminis]|uniref:pyocin S6 family toxin immunity protein n=1 Tax=Pseudomonas graminis TaxID=158627 RepID=UPI002349788D|nr:pyocin S6 family toxin immunity protein [Pseudomonas graminis]MDC6382396.1 pyocin S6 family toxin immunity protein [Pseudomonas graminis]